MDINTFGSILAGEAAIYTKKISEHIAEAEQH
jgi:hypothetical protein